MKKCLMLILLSLMITSCSGDNVSYDYPEKVSKNTYATGAEKNKKKLFGTEGIHIGGGDGDEAGKGSSIGVNSFLWRATLDTISFMPIASADPFGGVIITDWYSLPEKSDVQYKINAFILTGSLRADGIKITAFKREKKNKDWVDVKVDSDTVVKIEDAILTRARELKYRVTKK